MRAIYGGVGLGYLEGWAVVLKYEEIVKKGGIFDNLREMGVI